MAELQLHLKLDGGTTEYHPGGWITGSAVIESSEPWTAKFAELALGWHTEGVGDEDKAFVEIVTLAEKGAPVSRRLDHPFRLAVPAMPRTYHGRLIKILWTLGIFARAEGGEEQSLELPIVIRSAPAVEVSLPDTAPPPLPNAPLPWD